MRDYKELRKKIIALALAGGLTLTATGCDPTPVELGEDISNYDVLKNNNNSDTDNLSNGVEQVIDVENNDFKLVLSYLYNNPTWRITDNKKIFMSAKTKDLPEHLEVFIDNIHTDTSIVSTKATLDGIKQDDMDDRIHNSLMLGFPISDDIPYYGCNSIEGMNYTFIQGFILGINGYSTGTIEEKRFTEEDFLERGVWANRIDTIVDLIIRDKNTGEIVNTVSVPSTLLVEADNTIKYSDGTEYEYDREGNMVKTLKKTK